MSDLFRNALQAQKDGRDPEALDLYRRLLAEDPRNRAAWINAGGLLSRQGDRAGAVDCYRKALALREDETVRFNLGSELYRLRDGAAAIENLRRALDIKPDFFRAAVLLGYIYESLDDFDAAARAFQQALTLNPASRIAALGLVVVLGERDRNDEALQICSVWLKRSPDDASFLNLHAGLLLKLGRYKESFEELKEATRTHEKYVSFQEHLVQARRDHEEEYSAFFDEVNDRLHEKQEALRRRVEERKTDKSPVLQKDDVKDLVDLSLLHLFSGDREKALGFLLEARRVADREKKE